MNSRERLISASRGGEVDRAPVITWLSNGASADGRVAVCDEPLCESTGDVLVLADVPNPFGLALKRGIDLNGEIKSDPEKGAEILDSLVEEISRKMLSQIEHGADGIFYRLHGATPDHCSPMQYGGCYLERDRELLGLVEDATLIVLFVAGRSELYVDFVSDLPAHVFAWDSELSQVSDEQVRAARSGATASEDPASEIRLVIGATDYLENLEQPTRG